MNRKWTALLAAVLTAHTMLLSAAAPELERRMTRSLPAPGRAAEEALFLPAGDAPEPPPEPPEDEPPPGAEIRAFTDAPDTLQNNTGFSPDLAALSAEGLSLRLPAEGPQILILHTHGTEAYLPVAGETYPATDPYRTTDPAHSVIRVGEVLAGELERQGLRVVHDTSLNDYPSYAGAYDRSQTAAEQWLERYPDIAVIIDLHRDAVGSPDVIYKTCAQVSGMSSAQVMLVVGTGENGLEHPCWQENLKLALALQAAMEENCPTLPRPIHLVRERYNQHLTRGSLILEVGTNGNTLSEAERAAVLFARAAGPVLLSLAESE